MAYEELLPAVIAGGLALIFIISIIITIVLMLYVYFSFAWMTIAKKLGYKNYWLAWIPFAQTAMRFQLGKIPWQFVFLYLIPIFGWIAIFILEIIAKWHIFEKRNYPGWFALSTIFLIIPKVGAIPYGVVLGFVAWKDQKNKFKF